MKKIIYTDNAQKELAFFHRNQQTILEEIIKSKKYVFGDESIEITASDIREASRYIQAINLQKSRKTFFRRFILTIYMFSGILMILIGLFYPIFEEILRENPTQLMFVFVGVIMTFLSISMTGYFKYKDLRREQIIEIANESEKENKS